MRFEIPNCPECSESAASLIESVEVRSYLDQTNGQFFFSKSHSDVNWDTQSPLQETVGDETYVFLGCNGCGNCWQSKASQLDLGYVEDRA